MPTFLYLTLVSINSPTASRAVISRDLSLNPVMNKVNELQFIRYFVKC